MKLYAKAFEFAVCYHQGQVDAAGLPYVTHPIRVAELVNSAEAKAVAMLHDVLEDTHCTVQDLNKHFPDSVVNAVLAITKAEGTDYLEYLTCVRDNPISLEVKLADMEDNLRLDRLDNLTIARRLRLVLKYTKGRHYLKTGLWPVVNN